MYVKLSSRHYRRSPLVQGGIEIPCIVYFKMPSTFKNAQLAERYLQLVKDRYTEPKDEKILGSFITEALPELVETNKAKKQQAPKKNRNRPNHDIRDMFKAVAQKKSKPADVIDLLD